MKRIRQLLWLLILPIVGLACNTITDLFADESQAPRADTPIFTSTAAGQMASPAPFDRSGPPSDDTLRILEDTVVPENNPVELADRLRGIENVPDSVPPHGPYEVGDRRTFFVLESDARVTNEVETELLYESPLVYFWAEVGVRVDQGEMEALLRAFEGNMVPANRAFFGDEWIPGIDNDAHIYIVYSRQLGPTVAGVFVSRDELHPLVDPKSNAAEMFMVNASNTPLGSDYAYSVLAHEFQHMIHWYRDRNETSWINEGMSELATVLTGYFDGGFVPLYLFDTDVSLNDWPEDNRTPHYGASLLFMAYFLDRFGPEATQALVEDPANGLESVDNTLAQLTTASAPLNADTVILDWAIANYLSDPSVGDGRYAYNNYPEVLSFPPPSESISDCASQSNLREVNQYGVDYISIACQGDVIFHFEGVTQVNLLPVAAYSGEYAFWSNKGDESDITLTRAFDFSDISGPITLNYQTWFDIEEDWDYVYVLASVNGGDDWDFLITPSGTDTDPIGNNYGYGYTGASGDWINESVDLSDYGGQEVLIRFEYITDPAVNGEGLLVDDIAIPETSYFEDFEQGDGGWMAAGFARVQNALPQNFRLALISFGDETTVQIFVIPENNMLDIPLDFTGDVDEVTLVVLGTTRFTRQPAAYGFTFTE